MFQKHLSSKRKDNQDLPAPGVLLPVEPSEVLCEVRPNRTSEERASSVIRSAYTYFSHSTLELHNSCLQSDT